MDGNLWRSKKMRAAIAGLLCVATAVIGFQLLANNDSNESAAASATTAAPEESEPATPSVSIAGLDLSQATTSTAIETTTTTVSRTSTTQPSTTVAPVPTDAPKPEPKGVGLLSVCPIKGETNFIDTFGSFRSGGRTSQGQNMVPVDELSPVVAPISGELTWGSSPQSGITVRLIGDDGRFVYMAFLKPLTDANGKKVVQNGRVEAGQELALVGIPQGLSQMIYVQMNWERSARGINPYWDLIDVCGPREYIQWRG